MVSGSPLTNTPSQEAWSSPGMQFPLSRWGRWSRGANSCVTSQAVANVQHVSHDS
jgi:hypothetical protein